MTFAFLAPARPRLFADADQADDAEQLADVVDSFEVSLRRAVLAAVSAMRALLDEAGQAIDERRGAPLLGAVGK